MNFSQQFFKVKEQTGQCQCPARGKANYFRVFSVLILMHVAFLVTHNANLFLAVLHGEQNEKDIGTVGKREQGRLASWSTTVSVFGKFILSISPFAKG